MGSILVLFAASTTFASAGSTTLSGVGGNDGNPALLPTGQFITPTLAPGSSYQRLFTNLRPDGNADADSAMSSVLSPDGKTLLVLTSGFNTGTNYQNGGHSPINFPVLDPLTGVSSLAAAANLSNGANQSEFLFVYDIGKGYAVRFQKIPVPDTYNGIAWDPQGERFYVSGGIDDRILVYRNSMPGKAIAYVPQTPFIILNHNKNGKLPVPDYHGGSLQYTPVGQSIYGPLLTPAATVAGFDISRDGKTIVAANFHNASASFVDTATRTVIKEVVFTPPGSFKPIGEMPFWVSVASDPKTGAYAKAFVTSQRDDQVVVLSSSGNVSNVIAVPSAPTKSVLDAAQRFLYVACSNDDSIAVIDTKSDKLVNVIPLAPGDAYKGAVPNSLALNGTRLYVTLGGENAVAVVDLRTGKVLGEIPTGWMPTSVSVSHDGAHLFVVNEKSNAGPNPGNVYYSWNTPFGASTNPTLRNEYTWELEKSGLLSIPVPDASTLASLTRAVYANNNFENRHDDPMMRFMRRQIKHVIYIVNENRTYDQVLGDLGNGADGEPRLTFFTKDITPNLHKLAANFVTLDRFYDSSETSGVGWNWVMQGRTTDYVEKTQPVDYGNGAGGFTYDWQGIVNNINLGLPPTPPSGAKPSIFNTRITGILDPSGRSTILPGIKDPSATEGADDLHPDAVGGYIWENVLRNGGTVRNYGWQIDLNYYGKTNPFNPPMVRYPGAKGILEASPSTPSIQPVTDRYYRAFDQFYPDIWRIEEWQREFAGFVAHNDMPSLMTMTIPHDHTGFYRKGTPCSAYIEGLCTPQLELADHDYAVGQLVEALSKSPFWKSTVVVMLEDDPQDGQDHVEAHRSIIHVISPWTQTGRVVHNTYFTTSAVRTVEDLLGLKHYLGFNDANAQPISDAFTTKPNAAPYTAVIPGSLCKAPVLPDLVPACKNPQAPKSRATAELHDGAWWSTVTAGLDFSKPDHVNPQYYNQILEYGITGRGSLPKASAALLESKNYDAGDRDGDGK